MARAICETTRGLLGSHRSNQPCFGNVRLGETRLLSPSKQPQAAASLPTPFDPERVDRQDITP